MAGIISLIDWKGNVCDVRKYFYKVQRHDIIEMWGKVYGKNFERCTLSILPQVNSEAVFEKTGKNMRFKKDISAPSKIETQKINKQIRYADKLRLTTSSHL